MEQFNRRYFANFKHRIAEATHSRLNTHFLWQKAQNSLLTKQGKFGATAAVLALATALYLEERGRQPARADTVQDQLVYGWGSSTKGQLGLGTTLSSVNVPQIIGDLDGMEIISLQASSDRSAIVNSFGELFSWGSAKNGAMVTASGKAYPDNLSLPTLFETNEHQFSKCAVGRDHMAAITSDGRLLTMGSADHGKLGHSVLEQTAADKKATR